MDKKVVRNLGVFISIVIISGWLGVLVDSVLTGQPEGGYPWDGDMAGIASANCLGNHFGFTAQF